MERPPRHLACAALLLAACETEGFGDIEPCPGYAADFTFIEPDGAAEIIDGNDFLAVTWPIPPRDVHASVLVSLVDGELRFTTAFVDAAEGQTSLSRSIGAPPGVFHLEATLGDCATGTVFDGGPTRPVFVQGVSFAGDDRVLTGAGPHAIAFQTVSLSTMQVELWLDASPETTLSTEFSDSLFAAFEVPGELTPTNRSESFTGMTTTGEPIPAGPYRLVARIRPRTGSFYDLRGPLVTWVP